MTEENVRSIDNVISRVLATREGGAVRRCHTRRVLAQQSVAEHQYNALSLLLLLYPGTPPAALIKAVLWHDVGERWTGDVYGPFKSRCPVLGEQIDRHADARLSGFGLLQELTPLDRAWLDGVDLLEFLMWALDEQALGNTNFERDIHRVRTEFCRQSAPEHRRFPLEVVEFALSYQHRVLED